MKSDKAVTGLVCLKGGNLTEEIADARVRANLYDISDYFSEDFFATKKIVWIKRL